MTQTDRCPDCGDERRDGACPRCLIRLGLDGPSRTGVGTTTPPGVPETLAASIGPVPRVLLRDTDPGEDPEPVLRSADERDGSLRYRIDGEIARGGMGAVLKGRDPDLNRNVAIKVLRDDFRGDAVMTRRFVEEAQIGGQLQHPGVVPIYELGTLADRRPFFAMKLVKGRTLAALLEARDNPGDDLPRFLSIFETIAQTMAYAHARGVIHRDLKPSNVMVGSFGEVQVMDWGLAKVLLRGGADGADSGPPDKEETIIATARSGSDAPALSRPGSAMGTPAYMAPEQARGEGHRIDERADVFALGSILCEVLTGRPAFLGRSSGEILRRASLGDTADALARLDAGGADAELIAIARECLAREPEDRPRHAGEVAVRVTAYLAGVQDRLRAAELARAAEAARAEEAIVRVRAERRARQSQLGLAASLLALVTGAGVTSAYLLDQRHRREATITRILGESTALLEKARRNASDPAPWREAMAALERAEGQGPADQIASLRAEIRAGLDEAERMARLRQALVDVRASEEDSGDVGTDAAYAAAFRGARLDVDALTPDAFARRLRDQAVAVMVELAAFLDDWSMIRHRAGRPAADWRKPLEAARRVDPDPYRDRLRTILRNEKRRGEADILKALAAAPEAARLPAPTAVLLGRTLWGVDQSEAAVTLLRSAAGRHPDDVWINYTLGGALEALRPPALDEALRYYTAARALRPETAHVLAHVLERMGRGAEAEVVFRDLVKRRPEDARHQICLGNCLKEIDRADDARTVLDRAIDRVRAQIRIHPDDANTHNSLGFALRTRGKPVEAIDAFRQAIRLKPNYAGAYVNLGDALSDCGKPYEAIDAYHQAIRLKPDLAIAHYSLGIVLEARGRPDEAIAAYREAIQLKPGDTEVYVNLGAALNANGKPDEAIDTYHQAIRLKPDHAEAHYNLGIVLEARGRPDEAIAAYREAIRLKPGFAQAYVNLGIVLNARARPDEAIAAYRQAIRLKPDLVAAYYNLGVVLNAHGKSDEAIAAYRQAIRLTPNHAEAYVNLGAALSDRGEPDEAIAAYRHAIRLTPDDALAHYNLGIILAERGKLDEAIAEDREAIRLRPDYAEAHCNLGHLLRERGDYHEALTMLRRGHELGTRRPRWHYPSAKWVADLERTPALSGRLSTVLKGDGHPRNAAERLSFAQICQDTGRFAAAARFWDEAFEAVPEPIEDLAAWYRYNAACAAALAAAGQDEHEPKFDEPTKAGLRKKAVAWLRADLSRWSELAATPRDRLRTIPTLKHWKHDTNLATIREPDAIQALPDDEQAACRALWADVDALLARMNGGKP